MRATRSAQRISKATTRNRPRKRYASSVSVISYSYQEMNNQLTLRQPDSNDNFGYFPDVAEGGECIYGRPGGFVVKAGFVYDTYEGESSLVGSCEVF